MGKTKLMKVKTKSSQKTHANGVEIEEIDNFKYLGSYITKKWNYRHGNLHQTVYGSTGLQQTGENMEVINSAAKNKAETLCCRDLEDQCQN